ncbi:MAG TPA: histidine kinase dimerization/phospho-acceptor domain-containing protein, partial [Kofleriaceae bacterium]|nr:histidine kinase dimerization/phospho-acceptor domain-containing protein [Kofleriaceae bacterium]
MAERELIPEVSGTRVAVENKHVSEYEGLPCRPSQARIALHADAWRKQRDNFFLENSEASAKKMIKLGCMQQLITVGVLWHAGYATWRIVALLGTYVAFGVFHRLLIGRARCADAPPIDQTFILMNVTSQVLIVGSAILTGGAHSPFIPATLLPAVLSLLFFGPHAVARWMAVANGLLMLAMLALPSDVVGPQLPNFHYVALMFIGIAWNLFVLHMMVGKVAQVANRAGESVAVLREERLDELDAQLVRLQSVGAKVAHELKNPLASIKGLCQLVARTPESERTQERLAVVASEISRMETILSEYLSFSRPLEDLSPQTLDLKVVTQDVLDVLAGRAEQAGVSLLLAGPVTPAEGDPRRLKEALINLVSNAIEATPTGGRVVDWLGK